MTRQQKLIIVFIAGLLIASPFAYIYGLYVFQQEIKLGSEFLANWACMDGCYNMLEVEYVNVTEDMKPLHDECSQVCWNQWVGEQLG